MDHRMTIERGTVARATEIPPSLIAPLYLIGIAGTEMVATFIGVAWSVIGHALLISAATALAVRAASIGAEERGEPAVWRVLASQRFYVALTLPSLVRVVTLTMPLEELSVTERAGAIAVPLLGAAWAAARAGGYRPQDLGLIVRRSWSGVLIDLFVAASGVAIGYAAFRLLSPDPLFDEFTFGQTLAMSAAFIGIAAVAEAFILWGVLHTACISLFGSASASVFVAGTVAILHIGDRSLIDAGVAFAIALILSAARTVSRSLIGVLLAYGIASVCLFLIFPLMQRT